MAAGFAKRYPACMVDLVLSDARIDLVAGHVDLSVRVGWLDDSSQRAQRIGTFRQVLVASSDLARSIAARQPDDLAALPFIVNGALREPLLWHFAKGDFERRTVRLRQVISINTTPAVLAATRAGGGLAILPDFAIRDHLRSGRLVEILPEWTLPSGGIYIVYPAARFRPPKVTAFVAMLTDAIGHAPADALSNPPDSS